MQPYLSLEAELHDLFWEQEDGPGELPLLLDFLDAHPGMSLEIGCGSGRLLLPLLKHGHAVEGLELSADMIALAQAAAHRERLTAILHQGDMSTWSAEKPYATLLGPAFTLQLAADPAAALRHWKSLLAPGGHLYLTVFTPYSELLGETPEGVWHQDHEATLPDGTKALLETRHSLDPEARLLAREHRYTLGNRAHMSRQTLHYRFPDEWPGLLAEAGFAVTRAIADFDPDLSTDDLHPDDHLGILTFHAKSL